MKGLVYTPILSEFLNKWNFFLIECKNWE